METIRLTVGQAIVKFLDNQYLEVDGEVHKFVRGVFAIFGHGNVTGLGQALEEDSGQLLCHQGHNEQGMAHAAIAYAKQKNRQQIYVCTSSVGPGAANMVTAAATATVNRIPVLFLPGDTFACRQPDPVLQQVEDPTSLGINTNDAFRPVSRYWDRVNRPEQLMSAMINRLRVLTDPANTGAVTVCLPQDVQAEAYDFPAGFFKKRVHRLARRTLSSADLHDAVNLIGKKRKPIIICGGGVRYSGAAEQLKEFAERFNIPFGETQAGKGSIIWDHYLNLGGIGSTGNLAANIIAKEADLVIGIGTRFSDFTTASKSAFRNQDVDFIAINVCGYDAYKLDALPLIADAREALTALTAVLSDKGYISSYTDEVKAVKDQWNKEVERLFTVELEEGLSQTRVLGELEKLLADDAIIVAYSGSLPGCLQRVWRPKKPGTYHLEYGYSCMGYEINGALGVKLAEPDKEVYAMVGDGSFIMLHSELYTSIQEDKKINVIVFDNYGFQCIHNLQRSQGISSYGTEFRYRSDATGELTGDYVPVDFTSIGRGYGCKTYSVTSMAELKDALKKSKQDRVSTVIDIKVLPGTMTDGYESWWRVGVPEVAKTESVKKAHQEMEKQIKEARPY